MGSRTLSNNSFTLIKRGDESTLKINMTVDNTFAYEIVCTKDKVFGTLVIGNNPEIYSLLPEDPTSSIILKDVISSAIILCINSNVIRVWRKNKLFEKNKGWKSKARRIFDNYSLLTFAFSIFYFIMALMSYDKFIFFLSGVFFMFFCLEININLKKEKGLAESLSKIEDESEISKQFIEQAPEIQQILQNADDMIDQQIQKIRNNKTALN